MRNKEIDELEVKWNKISRMQEKVAGSKERQKTVILEKLGINPYGPGGQNISEPQLDRRFDNYIQTQRAKNNSRLNIRIGVLMVIITLGILVAMILIAVFRD